MHQGPGFQIRNHSWHEYKYPATVTPQNTVLRTGRYFWCFYFGVGHPGP